MKILHVKAKESFDQVFGADSFIQNWPNIYTKGVLVGNMDNEYYYVLKSNDGRVEIAEVTAFFSQEELDNHLEIIKEISVINT